MGDGQAPGSGPHEVAVIRPDQRDTNTGQTAGLQRFEAISSRLAGSQKLWMGYSVLGAGGRTGVHHHGDSETALYVLSGVGRWWVGDRLDEAREARAGDFVLIPPEVVHWEENGSDEEPCVMIVARSTQGAIVVNLPDHPFGPAPPERGTRP
ncbi:MAG: cupin domain-containing protein [Carbonactinosporaceae bacterium]